MIQVIDIREGGPAPAPAPARLALDPEIAEATHAICERVRIEGDAALIELTRRYDGADISGGIRVAGAEMEAAGASVPKELKEAIARMAERLGDLHSRQLPAEWIADSRDVSFGERVKPIASAGCYVPGGRASYPSTVLMTTVPARIAGVPRVVLCTPPAEDGSVPAVVLYAALVAGVDDVFRVGGAHAVAAMAYGTESIEAVDKIVGPGNVWVTAAKREVAGHVGIDGLAGPTELVIVADSSADPSVLAIDMVAQAEHDPHARTFLITTDPKLADTLMSRLREEAVASPRREIVESSLEHASIVLAADENAAARTADGIAPEHLQIVTGDPRAFLAKVRSYGAAFLGPHTPVSFGDYGVGSNHVLPTMGSARFASGLRAADFVTVSSFVEASEDGIRSYGPEVETVAAAEGLAAHARASEIRRGAQSGTDR